MLSAAPRTLNHLAAVMSTPFADYLKSTAISRIRSSTQQTIRRVFVCFITLLMSSALVYTLVDSIIPTHRAKQTPYELLGVRTSSLTRQINAAYQRRVQETKARTWFKFLGEPSELAAYHAAYETITDLLQRCIYHRDNNVPDWYGVPRFCLGELAIDRLQAAKSTVQGRMEFAETWDEVYAAAQRIKDDSRPHAPPAKKMPVRYPITSKNFWISKWQKIKELVRSLVNKVLSVGHWLQDFSVSAILQKQFWISQSRKIKESLKKITPSSVIKKDFWIRQWHTLSNTPRSCLIWLKALTGKLRLPKLSLPRLSLPKLSLPKLTLPKLTLPKLTSLIALLTTIKQWATLTPTPYKIAAIASVLLLPALLAFYILQVPPQHKATLKTAAKSTKLFLIYLVALAEGAGLTQAEKIMQLALADNIAAFVFMAWEWLHGGKA